MVVVLRPSQVARLCGLRGGGAVRRVLAVRAPDRCCPQPCQGGWLTGAIFPAWIQLTPAPDLYHAGQSPILSTERMGGQWVL